MMPLLSLHPMSSYFLGWARQSKVSWRIYLGFCNPQISLNLMAASFSQLNLYFPSALCFRIMKKLNPTEARKQPSPTAMSASSTPLFPDLVELLYFMRFLTSMLKSCYLGIREVSVRKLPIIVLKTRLEGDFTTTSCTKLLFSASMKSESIRVYNLRRGCLRDIANPISTATSARRAEVRQGCFLMSFLILSRVVLANVMNDDIIYIIVQNRLCFEAALPHPRQALRYQGAPEMDSSRCEMTSQTS